MDIYESVTDYISNKQVMKEWPEARALLDHAGSMRPRDWRLPVAACQAVDGGPEDAIPASACVACALIGILLIDDMLDDDPRAEIRRIGKAQAANFAAAFLTAGSQAILQSGIASLAKLRAIESLEQMILTLSFGQFLDVQGAGDEMAYWRIVRMKNAPFFGTALELGALFGGASVETAGEVAKVGSLYGEMIQIHDDMNDCMAVPANSDWIQNRSPLPILFARSVNHPDRARFVELCQRASSPDALREAQEILVRSGAISYCVDQLLNRYREARTILASLPIAHPHKLEAVLEHVIAPVLKLFEATGNPLPDLSGSTLFDGKIFLNIRVTKTTKACPEQSRREKSP